MKIFLNVKEIRAWLDLADETRRDTGDAKDLVLFHLAFSTGLRISDLLKLKKSQMVDKDEEIVRVLRIKTKKTKQIVNRPLREDCREAIGEYLGSRRDKNPYLFPPKQLVCWKGISSSPMSRSTAHRLFKKYLRAFFPESKLVGACTHTLRRSMAKIVREKTGSIESASRFLGHTSIANTQSYLDMAKYEDAANEAIISIDIS